MSHEGIRIVSAREAQRDAEHETAAGGCRDSGEDAGDEDGGHGRRDRLEGRAPERVELRVAAECVPCATCHEEREKSGRKPGEAKPKAQTLLVMYEAPARPVEVTPVGKYALKFKWTDGHEAGSIAGSICGGCASARLARARRSELEVELAKRVLHGVGDQQIVAVLPLEHSLGDGVVEECQQLS